MFFLSKIMWLFLLTLILGNYVFAQQAYAPCLDISQEISLGGNVTDFDLAELMHLVSLVTQSLENKLEGLSVVQAADIFPQVTSDIFIQLINQVYPDGGLLNGLLITQAMVQGSLNIDNFGEILGEAVKNPDVFVDIFDEIFSSVFNIECFEDPVYAITATVFYTMAGAVQYSSTLDQLGDIINTTLVTIASDFNSTETLLGLINPLLDLLDDAQDLGNLGGVLSFASDDVFNQAVVTAFSEAGVVVNPELIASIIVAFNDRIKEIFELDNSKFIPFSVGVMRNIVDALE